MEEKSIGLDWALMWTFLAGVFTAAGIAAAPVASPDQSWIGVGFCVVLAGVSLVSAYIGRREHVEENQGQEEPEVNGSEELD